MAKKKKLLKGKKIAVDATTLEADAAMKSIIRKETGEDWKEYLVRLMKEEGIEEASYRNALSPMFAKPAEVDEPGFMDWRRLTNVI